MPTTICARSPAAARRLARREVSASFDLGQMILSCPVCRTRYLVDEEALRGQSGRTVRCASCGHVWHQAAPPEALANGDTAEAEGRIEPALEVPPRPAPTLEIPPRPRAVPAPARRGGRSPWTVLRWLGLGILLVLAILAGVVVARGAVVALWPAAARLYALVGVSAEPPGTGLNIGKTTQDLPPLRVALRDAGEKEVQFKIVDPPQARLTPGAVAHFKTPFDHPDDAAKGVVVTFAKH